MFITEADTKRIARARNEQADWLFFPTATPGEWSLVKAHAKSGTPTGYTVTESGLCDCGDHTGRGMTCKHARGLWSYLGRLAASGTVYCRECGSCLHIGEECPCCEARRLETVPVRGNDRRLWE